MIEVIEYTDPCCSWAWGSEPKLRRLRWQYGAQLSWRTVLGGLVHDASGAYEGMTDEDAGQKLAHYWSKVTAITSMPYPAALQWPPLTSHHMGQAVKAALFQGPEVADRLLRSLREAIFVLGRPADTWERILDVAMTVSGLDSVAFARELQGDFAQGAYELDWRETRRPNDHVRFLEGDRPGIGSMKQDRQYERYAFPTVIVKGNNTEHTLPGWLPYDAYESAFLDAGADGARELPSAEQALEHYGVLAGPELELLCGTSEPPAGAISCDWGGGAVFVTPEVEQRWSEAGWLGRLVS